MNDNTATPPSPNGGRLRLLAAVVLLVVLWCVVLPWAGTTAYLKPMIDRNERWGINPTALFYTDVEHMTYKDHLLRRPSEEAVPAKRPR
ncbi:hypothetical protein [Novipirellula galeiformis]|nr:hypothetical protein [Novipirellula galeiformis]